MKFSEITSRLNGISTPFFGLSWEPATSDVQVVRGLVAFLEGRRLLYEDHHPPDWPSISGIQRIEHSVEAIRTFLTEVLVKGGICSELAESIRLMRRACMDLLTELERFLAYLTTVAGTSLDEEESQTYANSVESARSHIVFFRHAVKIMAEVAQAHGIESDGAD
jgi:hypothetical protein